MRAAESTEPLRDDALDALFAPLAKAASIALAVSGGADSLALLHAIDRWRRKHGGKPYGIVLTVDHRLRRGSAKEAAAVTALARSHGFDARVLTWTGAHPTSDIEAEARTARYRLLIAATLEAGASHLLLAHHRDDVAETFLMRLERGAGVFGLAAMRPEIQLGDITIVRPFLSIPRSRLAATVAAAGLKPVDDPMNTDPRFVRSRMRQLMPLLAAEGMGADPLAATAKRLAGAADAIDQWASRIIAAAVAADALAIARLDPSRFREAPEEIRYRVLTRILIAVGGEAYPPRFERLNSLAEAIHHHDRTTRFKRTLAGTVVEWRSGRFQFYREIGRDRLPTLSVGPGYRGQWDHRFAVSLDAGGPSGLKVGPLGEDGRIAIGLTAADTPASALAALPAFRRGRAIMAVPPLHYFAKRMAGCGLSAASVLEERLAKEARFPDLNPEQ